MIKQTFLSNQVFTITEQRDLARQQLSDKFKRNDPLNRSIDASLQLKVNRNEVLGPVNIKYMNRDPMQKVN